MSINVFDLISRYFWLAGLAAVAYEFIKLSQRAPRESGEGAAKLLRYRNWFGATGAFIWLIMGAGQLTGFTPTVWYYFRPQDLNPFVVAFFASVFGISLGTSYWVLFRGGARKAAELGFFSVPGGNPVSERTVKIMAAGGPLFLLLWVGMCALMNVPVRN